jgi:hypothetical protein
MLYGSRDRELPISGRRMRANLIANGDAYWKDTRTLSGSADERACEVCGRGTAITLKLRSTDGYIVYRTLKSSRPITLCKECGLEAPAPQSEGFWSWGCHAESVCPLCRVRNDYIRA